MERGNQCFSRAGVRGPPMSPERWRRSGIKSATIANGSPEDSLRKSAGVLEKKFRQRTEQLANALEALSNSELLPDDD